MVENLKSISCIDNEAPSVVFQDKRPLSFAFKHCGSAYREGNATTGNSAQVADAAVDCDEREWAQTRYGIESRGGRELQDNLRIVVEFLEFIKVVGFDSFEVENTRTIA